MVLASTDDKGAITGLQVCAPFCSYLLRTGAFDTALHSFLSLIDVTLQVFNALLQSLLACGRAQLIHLLTGVCKLG